MNIDEAHQLGQLADQWKDACEEMKYLERGHTNVGPDGAIIRMEDCKDFGILLPSTRLTQEAARAVLNAAMIALADTIQDLQQQLRERGVTF